MDREPRRESAAELGALARELYLPEAGGALGTAFGRNVRSKAINLYERYYSLQRCKGSGGVNATASNWGGETAGYTALTGLWAECAAKAVTRGAIATMLIPLWESATWRRLRVPDEAHFVDAVVEWFDFP